ncbi:MAG: hypothetical protein NTY48_03030, partial [Candidatus Diapherotrites archaeon]|nr:hypothetical protein [Candidatus Diapherotrites archaeon]
QTLYGRSEELLKIDKGFDSLQSAASAILSTENVNNWKNQDAVSGLKTNWAGAESRFTNEEYDKAKDFAARAVTNIKQIITEGAKETVTESNDILIKAVIGLIAVAVAIFLIENLVLKKKKKEEDYNEPNY